MGDEIDVPFAVWRVASSDKCDVDRLVWMGFVKSFYYHSMLGRGRDPVFEVPRVC